MVSPSSVVMVVMLMILVTCSAQQFYASGRYGKREAPGAMLLRRQPGGVPVEVALRNDRFFFGSRYGKRALQEPCSLAAQGWNSWVRCVLERDEAPSGGGGL
ncbi:uncharacterized protein [Periplaneta americana]|uniref:uncharacterized protein n=1 Tax=Periplaneta americana TaxID=6978 RepID=UPI0037E7F186